MSTSKDVSCYCASAPRLETSPEQATIEDGSSAHAASNGPAAQIFWSDSAPGKFRIHAESALTYAFFDAEPTSPYDNSVYRTLGTDS